MTAGPMLYPLLLTLLAAPAAEPKERPLKPLPTLSKEPKIDGSLKEYAGAFELKLTHPSKDLSAKAAFRKDTLYLGLSMPNEAANSTDTISVELYFPNSGTTARGYSYTFGFDGLHKDPAAAPVWAQDLLESAFAPAKKGMEFELAIPARAFPRFQGQNQLALELCVTLKKADTQEAITNCDKGDMNGGPTRIPDDLRKNLKLNPPASVEGLEARPTGWVGYAVLHYPSWVQADETLTPQSLASLTVGEQAVEAIKVNLPIPQSLTLPDNRPIYTVLTGGNPYETNDVCKGDAELRMAMYVVKGVNGARVLEWPAATCNLGRAMRFELTPEGQLTIGYTNGSTAHFVWSGDHFERSELGKL